MQITVLEGLGALLKLRKLDVSKNAIKKVEGLDSLVCLEVFICKVGAAMYFSVLISTTRIT